MVSVIPRMPVQREYLYYSRPGAPYKGAAIIQPNEKLRFAMKSAVISRSGLSDGAVRLYLLLDDLSGYKGESWASQATLAWNLDGISTREVRNRAEELTKAGYLRMVREQRKCRYILGWVSDRNKRSTQGKSAVLIGTPVPPDRNTCSDQDDSIYLTEPSIESSSVNCPKCQDTGRVGGLLQGGEVCTCVEGQAIHRRLWRKKRA